MSSYYFFIFIYITYSDTIIYQFLDGNEELELFRISPLRKVIDCGFLYNCEKFKDREIHRMHMIYRNI